MCIHIILALVLPFKYNLYSQSTSETRTEDQNTESLELEELEAGRTLNLVISSHVVVEERCVHEEEESASVSMVFSIPVFTMSTLFRAVGAGLAGPAATGPIFGQLTRAKMPYELWRVVQLLMPHSQV